MATYFFPVLLMFPVTLVLLNKTCREQRTKSKNWGKAHSKELSANPGVFAYSALVFQGI